MDGLKEWDLPFLDLDWIQKYFPIINNVAEGFSFDSHTAHSHSRKITAVDNINDSRTVCLAGAA